MKAGFRIRTMVVAALLSAVGILIPMVMPRFVIEPMSYTLASHVPVFLAMFISPVVGLAVTMVSSIGFFLAGFSPVVVLRALSHLLFVFLGAWLLLKREGLLKTTQGIVGFGLLTGLVHAAAEVIVVTFFYVGGSLPSAFAQHGYWRSVMLLVGVGTVVHSLVDFALALLIWKQTQRMVKLPVSVRF